MNVAAQQEFLDSHDTFMRWSQGRIVIETLTVEQFLKVGGDLKRFTCFFEDYGNMADATRYYIRALTQENR